MELWKKTKKLLDRKGLNLLHTSDRGKNWKHLIVQYWKTELTSSL
jgi:hypothetical protein